MDWNVEYTGEFKLWWSTLFDNEQDDVAASARLLAEWGPYPRFPHSSWINCSRHRHMRELRIRSGGSPFRLFYAFDPRRVAILLIGGVKADKDKTGAPYNIARADWLYDAHIEELAREEAR